MRMAGIKNCILHMAKLSDEFPNYFRGGDVCLTVALAKAYCLVYPRYPVTRR
jgi:hypothetical protein